MYCIHCGAEISNTAKFCPECGKILMQSNVNNSAKPEGQNQSASLSNQEPFTSTSSPGGTKKNKNRRRKAKAKRKKGIMILAAVILLFVIAMAMRGGSNGTSAKEDSSDAKAEVADASEADPAVMEEAAISEENSVEPETIPVSEEEPLADNLNSPSEEEAVDSYESTAEKIERPETASEANVTATPLSDFWVALMDDHTITLRSFETHDKICVIPSEYTVDGEQWPVTRVDEACFFGRTSLNCLVIPEGVETIAHNAFNSCGIETFYFPSSLRDITGIFEYLGSGKKTIYYAGDSDSWWAIQGADGLTDNIELYGNTPVPAVVDSTNYASSNLILEKSRAEQLGEDTANAINGFFKGLNDAMEENKDR